MISPKLVTIPKTADGQLKVYWTRPGFENIHLDTVSSKFEEKFKKTFLENQTGFHQPTKQEVIAHQHKSIQRLVLSSPKIASKNIWENLSWTSSTSRLTPFIARETSCWNGSWFTDDVFLKLALFNTHDTFKTGNWSSHVFLKLVYLTNHDIFNFVKRQCG